MKISINSSKKKKKRERNKDSIIHLNLLKKYKKVHRIALWFSLYICKKWAVN